MAAGDRQYWQGVAEGWLAVPPRTWRAHSDAVYAQLLASWLPPGRARRALKTDAFDEAVSAGLFPQLEARAETVVAVDISHVTLLAAADKYERLIVAGADLRCLPFAAASFDAVISLSSLDHFETHEELAAGLRELSRVLAPGGTLIITLDNSANPLVALRNALPFAWLHAIGLLPYRVGRTSGPRRLRALLQSAGFEVEEVAAVLHAPRVAAVAMASLVDRLAYEPLRRLLMRLLLACEHLARWPTRFLTGYYVAARARRLGAR